MSNLRDLINAAADSKKEAVEVPEWGATVYLHSLTSEERDDWEIETYALNEKDDEGNLQVDYNRRNLKARFVARCLRDESGVRAFSNDQTHELGLKNAKVMDRLYDKCSKLNGVSKKDTEALAKNS